MGAQGGAHRAPWAPAWGPMGPLGPRGYIGKLPINRPNGGVLVYVMYNIKYKYIVVVPTYVDSNLENTVLLP